MEVRHAIADALSCSKILLYSPSSSWSPSSSYIQSWNTLLQLMQDDSVHVRISARRAACESMGCKTMMLAPKTLRNAYTYILNICTKTKHGQMKLHHFLHSYFNSLIESFYAFMNSKSNDGNNSSDTTTTTTMEVIKVFDDERENFFNEPLLEIELKYNMLMELNSFSNSFDDIKNTNTIKLFNDIMQYLNSSTDLMYFSNEKRFQAVYGSLLYIDCLITTVNTILLTSLQHKYDQEGISSLLTDSILPSPIVNIVEKIENTLNAKPDEENVKFKESIFRL